MAQAILAFFLLALAAPPGFTTKLTAPAAEAFARADRALVETDPETAARELERVLELQPDFPEAYALYAFALRDRPDALRAAADRLRKLAEATPDRPALWYGLGRLEADRAARDAAFRRVVELAPREPWGYLGLAFSAREARDFDTALPLYEKARALAPRSAAVAGSLAVVYAPIPARRPEARKLLEEVVRLAPGSVYAENAAEALLEESSGDAAGYADLVRFYVRNFPNGRHTVWAYTYTLKSLPDREAPEAQKPVAEAVAAVDRLRGPFFAAERGEFFSEFVLPAALAAGRPAVEQLAAARLAQNEDSPYVLLTVAQALEAQGGDAALAVKVLDRARAARAAFPKPPEALGDDLDFALGRAYARAGDDARAAEAFERVRLAGPLAPRALSEAAAAYGRLSRADRAFDALARAAAVKPTAEYVAALSEAARKAGKSPAEADAAVRAVRDRMATPAPDFTLPALDGGPVALSSYKGKVVLLAFWFPT